MGLRDRPYWRDEQTARYGRGAMGGMTIGFPKPGRAVKVLLIINVAVFVVQAFADQPRGPNDPGVLSATFGATVDGVWQVWRYVTFQFLHSGFWHIALNMLGLYMLGSALEKHWGSQQFVRFYLICGAVGGLAYVAAGSALGLRGDFPIIGASGGVFGILLACAILFPQFRLILYIFPVPIRLAAVLVFGGMILVVLRGLGAQETGPRFWSDVCHLGGAVTAAFWIWLLPGIRRKVDIGTAKIKQGSWQRKMDQRRAEQQEIDRILDKIQRDGIANITSKERDTLRKASMNQRRAESEMHKSYRDG